MILCAIFCACSKNGTQNRSLTKTATEPAPVEVSRALYHNPDSLLFYAGRAYLHDDPKGLFVTGAAAYLRAQDPCFPDSCTTVPLSEASIMLLRAAELGYDDADKLIHCLQHSGEWTVEPLNE